MVRYKTASRELRLPDLRNRDTVVPMDTRRKVRIVSLLEVPGWWPDLARTLCDAQLLRRHLTMLGFDVTVSHAGLDQVRCGWPGYRPVPDGNLTLKDPRLAALGLQIPGFDLTLDRNKPRALELLRDAVREGINTEERSTISLTAELADAAIQRWPGRQRPLVFRERLWSQLGYCIRPDEWWIYNSAGIPALVASLSQHNELVIVLGAIQRGYERAATIRMIADAVFGHDGTHCWVGTALPWRFIKVRIAGGFKFVAPELYETAEQALIDAYSPAALRLGLQLLGTDPSMYVHRDCDAPAGSVEWTKALRYSVMDDAEKLVVRSAAALHKARQVLEAHSSGILLSASSDGPDRVSVALIDEFVRQINEGLHMQSAFNVAMRTVRELTNASRQRDLHRLRHLSDVLITMCTILGITARD